MKPINFILLHLSWYISYLIICVHYSLPPRALFAHDLDSADRENPELTAIVADALCIRADLALSLDVLAFACRRSFLCLHFARAVRVFVVHVLLVLADPSLVAVAASDSETLAVLAEQNLAVNSARFHRVFVVTVLDSAA